MEERRPDRPSGSPEMHTGRLICGLAGTFYTGKDQSFALDVKVSTTSYLELGGQVVGEGEELDLVQSQKGRCEGWGACRRHLMAGSTPCAWSE